MARHFTSSLGIVRESADTPRVIEGMAIPYGVVSGEVESYQGSGQIIREAWTPGAFRDSVASWSARSDGARMAFRPKHGERPVGTVQSLEDTPDGVMFRAKIFATPAGDQYLGEVREGLNGVSVEASLPGGSRKMRDGTMLHRSGRLIAIAGSVNPGFDGARIAVRDMEEVMSENETSAPVPEAVPLAIEPPTVDRSAVEHKDATLQAVAGGQISITRAEAVYGPRSEYSFVTDGYKAQIGHDMAAAERQSRHYAHLADIALQIERAGEVLSSEIPGAYPNEYLPGLLTPRILKGRPMGGFYNRVPISDARPKIFAKVSVSTTVAVQAAEGTNPVASDFATTAVTATPLLYGAETVVSRQVLDGGDPSATFMVINDMIEAYAQASETVIKTAVEAGAAASGTAIALATPYAGLIGNLIAYQQARFTPALGQFIPAALYTTTLQQADSTGRTLLAPIGPFNSMGTIEGGGAYAALLASKEFLSWASTVNVVVTGRPSDYVIYESSIAQFSYDAVTGPQGVRMGIWAYLVVGTRDGSLKVTAA